MLFQIFNMYVGGKSASKALDNAARFLRDGDWRSALEEYREAVRFYLGERKGEQAMVAVLDVLEREGFDTGNLYAQYLGLAEWSSKHIKGPGKGAGQHLFELIVPFAGRSAHREDMLALQSRAEDVAEQLGLFWNSLPHLVEARRTRDEVDAQRPLLSPSVLRALMVEIQPSEGESVAEARHRLVESLADNYRAGASTFSLMEEVDSLRVGGIISAELSDRLVDVLLSLPSPAGYRGQTVRMWRPLERLSAEQLEHRRRVHTGMVSRRAPAGRALRTSAPDERGRRLSGKPIVYWLVLAYAWLWIALAPIMLLGGVGAAVTGELDGFGIVFSVLVPAAALGSSLMTLVALRKRDGSARLWACVSAMVTVPLCLGFVHTFVLVFANINALPAWLEENRARRLEVEPAL
jgi:hypothetical protein